MCEHTLVIANYCFVSLTISSVLCDDWPAHSPQDQLQSHLWNVTTSIATKMTLLYYPAKMSNTGSSLQIVLLTINIFCVELGQSKTYCVEGCMNEGSPIPAWSLKSLLNAQNKVWFPADVQNIHKIHIFSSIKTCIDQQSLAIRSHRSVFLKYHTMIHRQESWNQDSESDIKWGTILRHIFFLIKNICRALLLP